MDQADDAIVELVLTLGRRFGLGVVAEGVETTAQRARLIELGWRGGARLYVGRPMPAADIGAMPMSVGPFARGHRVRAMKTSNT